MQLDSVYLFFDLFILVIQEEYRNISYILQEFTGASDHN